MRIVARLFLFIALIFAIDSCRPELDITTNPSVRLSYSIDTVLFDTVFTSLGSTYRQFKIYNKESKAVKISEVKLVGGNSSAYTINVDGFEGPSVKDVEIRANDSLFVFVRVTIDPNNEILPFIVTDSIQFISNGNVDQIQLAAYGQNAHFYHDSILPPNTFWSNDLPHVVYGFVGIDTLNKLTIQQGAKVHFHKKSSMLVLGTLDVQGSLHDSVIFQGDRLEKIYFDEPGQWSGIFFLRGSVNNRINYALVKNSVFGIFVDSASINSNPNLIVSNSIVKHINTAGISAYNDARIELYNNLIFDCGQYAVLGYKGADVTMVGNTIGNAFTSFSRQNPSCAFADYFEVSLGQFVYGTKLKVIMVNNIIWGNQPDEFFIRGVQVTPSLLFEYNLIKTTLKDLPINNVLNENPLFIKENSEDYHLDSLSPAIGKGFYANNPNLLTKDLDGITRKNPPTIGCYER